MKKTIKNRVLKMQLQSLLIPIVYALFLKLFNVDLSGENKNIGFLMYLIFVLGGILDLFTFLIALIVSYITHYIHMKKNLNAFGVLDLLGKPKFLEKYYVNIDILFVYIITASIVLFLRTFISNNASGDFTSGIENFGYIFVYPLFWSIFNYYIAAFFYNLIAISKFMASDDYERYLDETGNEDERDK